MKKIKLDYKFFILKYFPFVRHRFGVTGVLKSIFKFLRYLPGSSVYFGPPRGIYLDVSLHNCVNKTNPIVEILLEEEKEYIRELPLTNSALVLSKFKGFLNSKIIEKKGFFLTDARYFKGYGGTVVSSDDRIFLPCSPLKNEWDPFKHQSLYRLNLPKYRNFKKVVLLDTKSADNNYCHWLRDHLTRFYWLEKMNLNLDDYTLISTIGKSNYHTFSYKILKKKGFHFKDVITLDEVKHFKSEVLVVPPYVTRDLNADNTSFDEAERVFLQNLFIETNKSTSSFSRIFISRRRSIRTSPQEAELVERLSKYEFKEIILEDYDISQQAAIFNNANIVIGYHGAGFANLYFCKPKITVIEIFSPDFIVSDYWALASQFNYRYFAYCEDGYKKNISNYRVARQSSTNINIKNFIDFCLKENLI